jgi:hypothetical protein
MKEKKYVNFRPFCQGAVRTEIVKSIGLGQEYCWTGTSNKALTNHRMLNRDR